MLFTKEILLTKLQNTVNYNEKIQSLIEKLFSCENHMYSPRNKKIVETLTIDEIKTKLL